MTLALDKEVRDGRSDVRKNISTAALVRGFVSRNVCDPGTRREFDDRTALNVHEWLHTPRRLNLRYVPSK